jgi:hypothetical protein
MIIGAQTYSSRTPQLNVSTSTKAEVPLATVKWQGQTLRVTRLADLIHAEPVTGHRRAARASAAKA